ncbi:MAG TPA: hypothetical protein VJY63_05100 [Marinospirillum sp.]|uniref:hypothetical protein n=1 Tax=Marinospirillum sp. TaxID=2183934 RepID=UPI002B47BE21|nr:hypothetical protein [Marinospirillum sp.]HKM15285.1 hypothetical protein [Marinospirillum sp.]
MGISADGEVIEFMGEQVVQEFSILWGSFKGAGIFVGVFGAVQLEKEEQLTDLNNS